MTNARRPLDPRVQALVQASCPDARCSSAPPASPPWRPAAPARARRPAVAERRRHRRRQAEPGRRPVRDREGRQLGELDPLPGLRRGDQEVPDARGLPEADRDQGHVRRGHRRQRHVLRQDPEPAEQRPGHRQGRHRLHRLDGRPLHPVRASSSSSTRPQMPNAKNLLPALQNVDFDPGRKYSLTWQSGFGVLAWNKEKVPGGLKNVCRPLDSPSSRAGSRCSRRCATRSGLIMLEQGVDISKNFTDGPVLRRPRRAAEADRRRPDPAGQGQLLQGGPDLRRRARGDRLVRRHLPDQRRERRQVGLRRCPRPAARSGATTCWCRSDRRTRRTPRS